MRTLVRADALPEGFDYPDTGCSYHPSCVSCPLPHCRYDSHLGVRGLRMDIRTAVAKKLGSQGRSIEEIQRALAVSRRTVYRLLARPVSNIAMSRSQRVNREGGARAV